MKTIIVNRKALDAMAISSFSVGRLPAIGERKIGEDSYEIDLENGIVGQLDKIRDEKSYSEIIVELILGEKS